MKVWVLVILAGISSWGFGGQRIVEFDSKEACYEALDQIKSNKPNNGDSQWLAFCKPKDEGQ